MIRILVDPYRHESEVREHSLVIDTDRRVKVDFSESADSRSTTVSSVIWSSEGCQSISISNEALSSGVATADVKSTQSGRGLVKVLATYADGATDAQYFRLLVSNPER